MSGHAIRVRARNRAIRTVALALAGIAAALLFGFLGFRAQERIPWRDYDVVHAQLRDLANLPPRGAEVRIAGKRVGQVLHPRLTDGVPTIDLQLEGSVGALHPDASLRVRPRGLLGVQYVDLNPGNAPGTLPNDTIPVRRTSATVDLPRALSTFDAPRRAHLRTTLRALGAGFAGRGPGLNDALGRAPDVLGNTAAVSSAILARSGAAQRFAPDVESAAAAADPVREDIAQGFEPQREAIQPFVDRAQALRQALTEAPSALAALRTGLAETDPLLVRTAAFARATTRFTRVAPKALSETTVLLRRGRVPLRETDRFLRQAASSVPTLLRFTRRIDPQLPPLRRALAANVPPLRELGPRGCDMLGYWSNWRSMLGYATPEQGPIGPLTVLRFELIASGESAPGGGPAQGTIGRNPYPGPCQAGSEGAP